MLNKDSLIKKAIDKYIEEMSPLYEKDDKCITMHDYWEVYLLREGDSFWPTQLLVVCDHWQDYIDIPTWYRGWFVEIEKNHPMSSWDELLEGIEEGNIKGVEEIYAFEE